MINFYDEEEHLSQVGQDGHTVVIYSVTKVGRGILASEELPYIDYFIDKSADDIICVEDVPVVTLEAFNSVKIKGGGRRLRNC